ncbi:MAG: cation diffusion facilitator family transporter [Anaerolineaceae bacterium]
MDSEQRTKQSNLAVTLGLVTNIILAILKTSIGVIGNSPALLADGINSTSDVIYYLVVGIFIRKAHKPADPNHPYGHTQFESVGALVVGAFVITSAVSIFWNSLDTLVQLLKGESSFTGGSPLALWVAIGTVLLKIVLFSVTSRIGKQTNNASVVALAFDHRNDIMAASAAAIGILLGRLGFLWVDPFAGMLVALFILRTGVSILRDAATDLMDTIPGKVLNEQITTLVKPIEGVKEIDEVHAHRYGQYYMINITICVDGRISVYDGDVIASLVEKTLMENIDYLQGVYVHYHPRKPYRAEV